MRFTLLATSLLVLSGCAGGLKDLDPERLFKRAAVAVPTGCVPAGSRPVQTTPLNVQFTAEQWKALPPGVRAKLVAAQGGTRMTEQEQLRAATSACPEVTPTVKK